MGPAIKDIVISTNSSFYWDLRIQNGDGTNFDTTGYTAIAQVREYPGARKIIVSFTTVVSLPGPPGNPGGVTLTLTDAQTAALPPGIYHYDLVLQHTTAPDIRLLKGKAIVETGVSQ